MTHRIAVIGAGISGLACAMRLHAIDPGAEIAVYERDSRAGGKILTEHAEGFVIEAGPDAFLSSKRGGVSLSHELGLDERMISPKPENRRSFVLNRGRLVAMPQGLSGLVPSELKPMFQSRLLSPAGKARMAMELVIPPRSGNRDESLSAFISRRFGREMYERLVEPLLSGIYAGDGDRLSLAATFPQLRASEITHGGLLKGALAQKSETATRQDGQSLRKGFLSFDKGMIVLVEGALATVQRNGARVVFGAECTRIQAHDSGRGFMLTVREEGRESTHAVDGVVVAVPGWTAGPLLRDTVPVASEALGRIDHVSNALIAIAFPESELTRPLDGYGYVVPRIEHRDVMAMTWISSKWDRRAPDGQVLLRAFVGRIGQTAALDGDDDSLVAVALRELHDVLDLDVTPTLTRVYRWDRGMPQYNMGHPGLVDRIESSFAATPGIEIAGNMLRGVGIPDCIVSGETAAANLMADLSNSQHRAFDGPVTSGLVSS